MTEQKREFTNHAEEIAAAMAEREQADGAADDLRLVPEVEQYTCWDCGTVFTPTIPNQRECTRCYVAGKL